MHKVLKTVILVISVLLFILSAYAQEAPKELSKEAPKEQSEAAKELSKEVPKEQSKNAPKEQNKGLDEQVQDIKTDVLSIAAELNQLEEKLLYPSDTQVAIFVSVAKGEKFRLD